MTGSSIPEGSSPGGDLERLNPSKAVALVLRVVLGAWFLGSGGWKVFVSGLDRFTRDIANYKMVGQPWDAVAAYMVPWCEMIVGVCLMLGLLRRGSLIVLAAMVAVFCFSIGWAWWHGLDISCGCHGGDSPIRYWAKVLEFGGYWLVIGYLWWSEGGGRMRAGCSS